MNVLDGFDAPAGLQDMPVCLRDPLILLGI